MEILYTPNNETCTGGLSVALGFFDGVHLAHQKILKTAVSLAKENGLKSAVITFKKSPGGYFDKSKRENLQTLQDRLLALSKTGVDFAYVLDFENYKNLTAEEYLKNVLLKHFNPKFIVTGFNHTFGLNKQGNSDFLYKNQHAGYKYIEVEKMRLANTLVSSTNIKKFIQKAYIKEANTLLGYSFNLEGKVIKGMGLARELGFKTANLNWDETIVKPPYGVYFCEVEHKGVKYKALVNWGVKPTVNSAASPVLEAHILDFDKEIYGDNIRIYFKAPIREEKKFPNLESLKAAILDDINLIQNYKC